MTAVELSPELEQAVRDALPAGCEMVKQCGHLCGQPETWTVRFHCDCQDEDAVICDQHILPVRNTDYVCGDCNGPTSLTVVRRL